MPAQVEIWATPGTPLREADWREAGFTSLKLYLQAIIAGHEGHRRNDCLRCEKASILPYATFGTFDPRTGATEVLFQAETIEDLPEESIPNVLIFD